VKVVAAVAAVAVIVIATTIERSGVTETFVFDGTKMVNDVSAIPITRPSERKMKMSHWISLF